MYCSFPNTIQYSSTHTVSSYSTVQHTQCHVTVQFNTHFIVLQYSSLHTVSCYSAVQHILYHLSVCIVSFPTLYSTVQQTLYHVTVQFNTHSVMLQCSSAHTVLCYSTIHYTQCHVTVQFSTNCIISLYVLFLSQHCTVQFNTHCIMLQ